MPNPILMTTDIQVFHKRLKTLPSMDYFWQNLLIKENIASELEVGSSYHLNFYRYSSISRT